MLACSRSGVWRCFFRFFSFFRFFLSDLSSSCRFCFLCFFSCGSVGASGSKNFPLWMEKKLNNWTQFHIYSNCLTLYTYLETCHRAPIHLCVYAFCIYSYAFVQASFAYSDTDTPRAMDQDASGNRLIVHWWVAAILCHRSAVFQQHYAAYYYPIWSKKIHKCTISCGGLHEVKYKRRECVFASLTINPDSSTTLGRFGKNDDSCSLTFFPLNLLYECCRP